MATRRTIALDRKTVTVLRARLRRQRAAYLIAGRPWLSPDEHGLTAAYGADRHVGVQG